MRCPDLVAECAEQWELELETPMDTPHSLVVPAGDVVLKLNAPSHCRSRPGAGRARALERSRRGEARRARRRAPRVHLSSAAGRARSSRSPAPTRRPSCRGCSRSSATYATEPHPFTGSRRGSRALARRGTGSLCARRPAVRAISARAGARRVRHGRPVGGLARQPGSPRAQRPPSAARTVARHRSEAASRRARARRCRPASQRRFGRRRSTLARCARPRSASTANGSGAGAWLTHSPGDGTRAAGRRRASRLPASSATPPRRADAR